MWQFMRGIQPRDGRTHDTETHNGPTDAGRASPRSEGNAFLRGLRPLDRYRHNEAATTFRHRTTSSVPDSNCAAPSNDWPDTEGLDALQAPPLLDDSSSHAVNMYMVSVVLGGARSKAAISIADPSGILTRNIAQAIADLAEKPVYTHLDDKPFQPRKPLLVGADDFRRTFPGNKPLRASRSELRDAAQLHSNRIKEGLDPQAGFVVLRGELPRSQARWKPTLQEIANTLNAPIAVAHDDPREDDVFVALPQQQKQ